MKTNTGCAFFLIMIFIIVSFYNACEAQEIELYKFKRQQTGKKIVIVGTGMLIYQCIHYSGSQRHEKLPKYSPAVGGGVMGLGMIIDISGKKTKKAKKKHEATL